MHPTIGVLILCLASPACAAPPPQGPALDPKAAATWLPLQPGHRCVWQVDEATWDEGGTDSVEALVWGEVPVGDAGTCTQVFEHSRRGTTASYWRADASGLWCHAPAEGTSRGASPHAVLWIPGPIGSVERWEWEEAGPSSAGAKPAPTMRRVGEIVAQDEPVTVPAGTFRTLHVRITSFGHQEVRLDQWFAAGTGLVQSELRTRDTGIGYRRETRSLLRCERGVAATDPTKVLQDTPGDHRDEPTSWLPIGPAACHLRGRFAVVRHRTGAVSCWFVDARARRIGPDDAEAWRHVLAQCTADEPRFTLDFGRDAEALRIGGEPPLLALVGLAARVECARRGLRVATVRTHETASAERGGQWVLTATETVVATDAGGGEHDLSVVGEQVGNDLALWKVTCEVPPPVGGR